MIQNRPDLKSEFPDDDSRVLELIQSQLAPSPRPSSQLQRRLREIPIRCPRPPARRTLFLRANMAAVGTAIALLAFALLSSPQPRSLALSDPDPFEQISGQWSYELFAPLEFEPLDPVYQNEFSLPSGYNSLEYWVY
jgi:hypothetical protein